MICLPSLRHLLPLLLLALTLPGRAGEAQVAVAANFHTTAQAVAAQFEQTTGHTLRLSSGSTGRFYAQIRNGAPFEVFLAADDETPARLEDEGKAVAGSRFTYAIGRLALWSPKEERVDTKGAILGSGDFHRLAIANPKLAPYGVAALETLKSLELHDKLSRKLVMGENVSQTYQMVATGNADLGLVAWSLISENGRLKSGSAWLVPQKLHQPLRQDAVLLAKGQDNPVARAFLDYLKTPASRALIRAAGYDH